MGTQRYLLGKVGQLFLTLLLILTLAFFLFRVWQPGDPVLTYARQSGSRYTPEQLDAIRHAWGLDIPLPAAVRPLHERDADLQLRGLDDRQPR